MKPCLCTIDLTALSSLELSCHIFFTNSTWRCPCHNLLSIVLEEQVAVGFYYILTGSSSFKTEPYPHLRYQQFLILFIMLGRKY